MGDKNNYSSIGVVETATIANGASLSGAIATNGLTPRHIQAPASQEGTAYTYQISLDGVTYVNFYDGAGAEVTNTIASSLAIYLDPKIWYGVRFFKIRTGTAASASAQTGAAAILVSMEAL